MKRINLPYLPDEIRKKPQSKAMTNDEIRIKIAESLGWSQPFGATGDWQRPDGSMTRWCMVPNYPESLDSCAEFEVRLITGERATYREHLAQVCDRDFYAGTHWSTCSVHASAKQRCLAYLKTKELIS